MKEHSAFSRLVSEMTLEERNSLRDKILAQSNISKDPLYEDDERIPSMDVDDKFNNLPWYQHLWFFILGLFKTISPVQLFHEKERMKLGKKIQSLCPDVFDFKRNILLPLFYQILIELRDGARFFYTALDTSINRDKGAFYAFLGSLEMENVHLRLSVEMDPKNIIHKHPGIKETELRKTAFHEMNEALATITEEQRHIMYRHARSLDCLKELASFRYDRLLLTFTTDAVLQGYISPAYALRDPLSTLNNILHSFKEPPSTTLIESLFIFILKEREDDEGSNVDIEIRELLIKAENALVGIRTFNKEIPLTLILRYAGKNMSLSPQSISGGEDWFVVYHEYWKNLVEEQLLEYRMVCQRQELFESFSSFLKGNSLRELEHAASESNPDGLPIEGVFSLSFLLTFYSTVFSNDINNKLRDILIDGRFAQRENRTVFTENYNNLIKLENDIMRLDNKLTVSGDYGKRYILASEESSLQVRRRKIQILLEDASDEAKAIIEQTKTAIINMIAILNAIITKEGDKYTVLLNMSHFLGRDETLDSSSLPHKGMVFLNGILDVTEKLERALQILENIAVLNLDNP